MGLKGGRLQANELMADETSGKAGNPRDAEAITSAPNRSGRTRRSTSRNPANTPLTMPVVGIGASAGGIEALGRFFDAMPPDSGCAFVVVLHLDPRHESEMALPDRPHEDAGRSSPGRHADCVPNYVYVIAPDTDLTVYEGGLRMSRPSKPRGQRHPVDVLFASIATEHRERAIAIVLSGTGNNGTEGLKEIRAEAA